MEQLKSLISGGVGGICLVLAGQPFDLIKVKMQTASSAGPTNGMMAIVRSTYKQGGLRAFYIGATPLLLGVTPVFALCFWAYDLGRQTIRSYRGLESLSQLSLMEVGLAGAGSAIPTTLITAPGERIKVLLQTQGHSTAGASGAGPQFSGPVDVFKHLLRTGGIRSVYRGASATFARDSIGSFAYFGAYEAIKRRFSHEGGGLSPTAILLGGSAAGIANWVVALPIDTVKNRIQAQAASSHGEARAGMLSVARQLVASEGVGGLFRGIAPALLRAVPANAACFLGMELSKKALDRLM